MKRIFVTLLILLSVISFQSCKKDAAIKKDPPIVKPPLEGDKPNPNAIYLVRQISLTIHGATTLQQLSYDDKNRIIEYKTKPINRLVWDRYEYTYDAANRMTKREYYDGDDKLVNTVDYPYTTSDTPVAGFIAVNDKNQLIAMGTDYLVKYDTQGRILFYGSSSQYQPGADYGLVYDDKNNPFKNVVGVNPHFNNQEHTFPAITTNNLLNNFDGGVWSFIYNNDNYPVSAGYINGDGFTYNVSYEYIVK